MKTMLVTGVAGFIGNEAVRRYAQQYNVIAVDDMSRPTAKKPPPDVEFYQADIRDVYETFCIASAEAMALGQPLIAPNAITFPEITGLAETKYPYLFSNVTEQKEMTRKLLTDHGERKRWGKTLSDYVRKSFNSTLWAQRYAKLFEELTECSFDTTPKDALDMLNGIIQQCDGQPFDELRKKVWAGRVDGRQPFSNQSMNLTRLLRMLRYVGAEVKMKRGQQVIVAP